MALLDAALPMRLRTESLTFVCPFACMLFLSASMMLTTLGVSRFSVWISTSGAR